MATAAAAEGSHQDTGSARSAAGVAFACVVISRNSSDSKQVGQSTPHTTLGNVASFVSDSACSESQSNGCCYLVTCCVDCIIMGNAEQHVRRSMYGSQVCDSHIAHTLVNHAQ